MEPGSDRRLSRRCTVVVAAAGFGKTTAVRDRLRGAAVRWHDESLFEQTGAVLVHAGEPTWLVADDVPEVDPERIVAFAGHLPDECRLVVISRKPPISSLARWRARGIIAEIGPNELVLSKTQVEALLKHEYGIGEGELVSTLTGGWPALVHMAGQALAADSYANSTEALLNEVAEFLQMEVLAELDEDTVDLLAAATRLTPMTADLAGVLGYRDAESKLELLRRTGLLRKIPLLEALLRRKPFPAERYAQAAVWYEGNGFPLPAVAAHEAAGELEQAVDLLVARGEQVLATGGAETVIRLAQKEPERLRLLHAQAQYARGDAAAALRLLADQPPSTALAWRLGSLHYLSGDPHKALEALAAAPLDGDAGDRARLHSWTAAVHWLLGNLAECAHHAEQAVNSAIETGEAGALAAAHVAKALHAKLAGDPEGNGEHYERALAYAEQARDAVQTTRIRCNRTSRLIDDARYAEALAEVRPAVRLAEEIGHVPMHALALVNEGDALVGLGRLDEALASFERSVWGYRRTGSRMVAYPLLGVAGIHRRRGRAVLAGTAYQETIAIAQTGDDRQALVPALAGLARLLATSDPKTAIGYAERALAAEPNATIARLAYGWAKLAAGDIDEAAGIAAEAAQAARRLQERALLPEALELMGSAAQSPSVARRAWREALELWQSAQAVLEADRLAVGVGALPGASPEDRITGKLAAARLATAGVEAGAPGYRVAVRTFGRFEVTTGSGEAVVWQSRKARDLLRILVARRGRPVPREELGELLWPGEHPTKVTHRLSVALSTVRGALDPDKRMPADHFLLSGQGSVTLDTVRIDIDLEDFLLAAEHGLRLLRDGGAEQARTVLTDACRLYTGEFLGDEPYDDWAVPAREEARAVYLRVVRTLVDLARDTGDTAEAVSFLYQILQLDPYDESAHRTVIDLLSSHGWHGEAQRARARFRDAMRDLGTATRVARA